jgi:hypothetical protein
MLLRARALHSGSLLDPSWLDTPRPRVGMFAGLWREASGRADCIWVVGRKEES